MDRSDLSDILRQAGLMVQLVCTRCGRLMPVDTLQYRRGLCGDCRLADVVSFAPRIRLIAAGAGWPRLLARYSGWMRGTTGQR
jgi:hypothetical protein